MTHPSVPVATLLVASIVAVACSRQQPRAAAADQPAKPTTLDLSALRRTIQEKNDRFTRAHIAGDVATIDAMFTRDATSFPPGAEAAVGSAAIHDLTVEYLKSGITEFREETTDLYGDDDMVVDQGSYVVTYGPDKVTERGKYLNVWKQEDGAWRIRANIWNISSSPAAVK